jgi:type IV secretory pathway VirB10-like protein
MTKLGFAIAFLWLAVGCVAAQGAPAARSDSAPAQPDTITIPAGTRIPLALKQAISTKTAKEGDPVYAQTTFPFAMNDRIVIPTGTYVQGKITHVKRGGRIKGRAEILIHFTSLVFPSGYTVMLPGSVENVPGAERSTVKGSEGTVQQDRDTGKKVKSAAESATTGALIGAIARGGKGAAIGGGIGGAAGLAIAMLTRGSDVRLEPGTSIEMEIQRDVQVDASRLPR